MTAFVMGSLQVLLQFFFGVVRGTALAALESFRFFHVRVLL